MQILFGIFLFCIVLFIYLHIQFHLKTSNDLEMYETDETSKNRLEEICDIRQPVIFDFMNDNIINTTNKKYLLDSYNSFELKIRNVNDIDYNNEVYIPLALHSAITLFNEDKSSSYFSEKNMDFLNETGVIKNMQYNDAFLRPYMVSNCNYDIIMGSEGTETPFRYEINYRNFFMVTQGSIQVKLSPPQSYKYLYPINDYENFEFRSPVNPWKTQKQYLSNFQKIKCLEFVLLPGKTLFIPAYWWYSIKFNKDTSISCFKYRTYMNNIAIIPEIGMYALQIQNVKRNVVKKVSINEMNNKTYENDTLKIENKRENENENENDSEETKKEIINL